MEDTISIISSSNNNNNSQSKSRSTTPCNFTTPVYYGAVVAHTQTKVYNNNNFSEANDDNKNNAYIYNVSHSNCGDDDIRTGDNDIPLLSNSERRYCNSSSNKGCDDNNPIIINSGDSFDKICPVASVFTDLSEYLSSEEKTTAGDTLSLDYKIQVQDVTHLIHLSYPLNNVKAARFFLADKFY